MLSKSLERELQKEKAYRWSVLCAFLLGILVAFIFTKLF